MLYRLRNNFQLSVITLMGACATLGITPFGVWRLLRGDWLIGLVDLGIVAGIVGIVLYAWRSNDTARSGLMMALGPCCGGAILVATLVGEPILFWLYPALICNFFLTRPWIAGTLALAILSFLLVHGEAFRSENQMWSFATTILVLCACAYVFARRSEDQRSRLERLTLLDPLTGVKNRRAMDEELNRAIATHTRYKVPWGLAMADLDHFKTVNDQHGHAVGDRILIEFVALLQQNTRCSDHIFRFGGEEFVILLPGADRSALQGAMEQLQAVVHQSLRCPSGPVTVSFGTAQLADSDSTSSWIARADAALYQAKQQGRDRIVAADPEPHPTRCNAG